MNTSIVSEVFHGRCRDLGLEADDESDFETFSATFKKANQEPGVAALRLMRLGSNAAIALAKGLKRCDIRYLDLFGNFIHDLGTMAVLQLLSSNPSIEYLDIGCNDIRSEGCIALSQELHKTNIKTLLLGRGSAGKVSDDHRLVPNHFNAKAFSMLFRSLREARIVNLDLSYLSLGSNSVSVRNCAVYLGSARSLEHLNLAYNHFKTSDFEVLLRGLTACSNLKSLNLSDTNLTWKGATMLGNVLQNTAELETLKLVKNTLGDNGLVIIAPVIEQTNIKELYLSSVDCSSFAISRLTLPPTIEKLCLKNNRIDLDGIVGLINSLSGSKIKYLNLSGNNLSHIDGQIFLDLLNSTSLEVLVLDNCHLTDESIAPIFQHLNPSLTHIYLRKNFLYGDSVLDAMEKQFSASIQLLEVVNLTGNQLNHAVSSRIQKLLSRNTTRKRQEKKRVLHHQRSILEFQASKIPGLEKEKGYHESKLAEHEVTLEKKRKELDATSANNRSILNQLTKELKKAISEKETTVDAIISVKDDVLNFKQKSTIELAALEKELEEETKQMNEAQEELNAVNEVMAGSGPNISDRRKALKARLAELQKENQDMRKQINDSRSMPNSARDTMSPHTRFDR
ncbi:hypothetical protein PCE1_004509 [Barthelona sp. PCE]